MSDAEKNELFATFVAWYQGPTEKIVAMYRPTIDGVGEPLGTVKLEDGRYGLIVTPDLSGLEPGPHGFHFHQNPDCGPKEKDGNLVPALAAGGHLDPEGTGEHHGPLFHRGHLGDLPVLNVADDGTATDKVLAPKLQVSDVVGRSLMVHGPGNDASRHACGVVE